MATRITKPVRRITQESFRDRSKFRDVIVTIYPLRIGLRLQGLRNEESIPIAAVYERAVKMRLASEYRERMEKKAQKAGVSYAVYVRRKRSR